MFGNDPRLPGARNAVPGSQNGVYSGLCLKMTLEVCLKMTPLPCEVPTLAVHRRQALLAEQQVCEEAETILMALHPIRIYFGKYEWSGCE